MKLHVSSKGWVVIPAELRRKYGLKKGDAVTIVDYGGVLALVPALEDPVRDGRGLLKGSQSLPDSLSEKRLEENLEATGHDGLSWDPFDELDWEPFEE